MLVITLGMEHREEDEDKQTLYTNYRAKAVIGDLMKRGMFPNQYSTLIIYRNFQAEVDIYIEVEKGMCFRKPINALTYNGQTGQKVTSAIDVKRYLGRTILLTSSIILRQAQIYRQLFITGSDVFGGSRCTSAFEGCLAV